MKFDRLRPAIRLSLWLAVASAAGALAGTIAAVALIPSRLEVVAPVATNPPHATSTVDLPPIVKFEPKSLESLIPPAFLQTRSSPVAAVYRKPKGGVPEERSLTPELLLGQAVSLTSDGWFVMPSSVLGTARLSDIVLWRDGKTYHPSSGVLDRLNGTVFISAAATELQVPAFGDVVNLVPGSVLWIERRNASFVPGLVTSLSEQLPATEPASSEVAARRIELSGVVRAGERGAPVWDDRGNLMGLMDAASGQAPRFIPITGITSSFFSLLSQHRILHATLGVRAVDLSAWRFDGPSPASFQGTLGVPHRGAWVKEIKNSKSPLKIGDVILRVERDILDGTADLGEILSAYRPGTSVVLRVRRGDQELDVPVTLGSAETGEPLK